MYSFKTVSILVCISFAVISVSGNEPIFKTFVHPGNEKIFTSPRVFEDGSRYVLASCNDSNLATELNCIITTDKFENFDVKNCPLRKTLPGNRRLKSDNFDLKLFFLGSHTNIMAYWDEFDPTRVISHFKGVAIMNMDNCEPKFLELFPYQNVPIMHIVVYNDTFDVITFDEPGVCDSKKRCRVTFDSKGKQIGTPHSFPIRSKDISIYPKSSKSGSDGFYIFNWEKDEVSESRIEHLSSDNQITELDISGRQYKKHPEPAVIIGYRRMTIYGWKVSEKSSKPNESTMIRTRIDIEDNEELFPLWNDTESQNVKIMTAYNLPNHHQYLSVKVYTMGDERKVYLSSEFHEVGSKPLNKVNETFEFSSSGYIQDLRAFVAEEEQGYCLYFSSIHVLGAPEERVESTLKYFKKCLPKNLGLIENGRK